MMKSPIRNSRGQSLIEMMIGVGLMGIMIYALASINGMISRENNALSEKLAALQVERDIITAISKRDATGQLAICSALFNAGNLVNTLSLPFPTSAVSPGSTYKFGLKQIPAIGTPNAAAGTRASPLSESLLIKKSTDTPPGIEVTITSLNPAFAIISVNFDRNRVTHSLRDLNFKIKLATAAVGANTQITGCIK